MKNKFGMICMIAGAVLVVAAWFLFFVNQRTAKQAEDFAEQNLPRITEYIDDQSAVEQSPDPYDLTMPVVEIDGYGYIGYLTIPELGLELPVMSEWDYSRLKLSPCRYTGSVKTEDFVIAAHNYSRHFGKISQLSKGSAVYFTDMDGVCYTYTVAGVEILESTAVEEMTSGRL